MESFLKLIIFLPLIPCYLAQTIKNPGVESIKTIIHMNSMTVAQTTFIIAFLFNEFTPGYIYSGDVFNYYNIAYDGISLVYLVVSAFLIGLCVTSICEFMAIDNKLKTIVQLLFLLETVLFNFFLTRDLFFFYVWFEATLPILFLIVLLGGERNVRIRASFMLFLYTLTFSMFTLCTIVYINRLTGSSDLFELINIDFSYTQQVIMYLGFLIGFAVKVPTNPFHVWLPHAHVEASTLGSVLLAGIILKMGGYAIMRILLPLCPNLYEDYGSLGTLLGYVSVINTSLIIITESDLKRLIAYFSIVHMNVALIANFAAEKLAVLGAIAMMISHSLVASGLFFCIGVLYERYQVRDMTYYGGLANASINFCIAFFILVLSNFSFPLTFGFWPEIIILTGLAIVSYLDIVIILLSAIFGLASNLIFFTKVFFSLFTEYIIKFADLTIYEMYLFCTLIFYDLYFGIFPDTYLIFAEHPVNFLLTALTITQ